MKLMALFNTLPAAGEGATSAEKPAAEGGLFGAMLSLLQSVTTATPEGGDATAEGAGADFLKLADPNLSEGERDALLAQLAEELSLTLTPERLAAAQATLAGEDAAALRDGLARLAAMMEDADLGDAERTAMLAPLVGGLTTVLSQADARTALCLVLEGAGVPEPVDADGQSLLPKGDAADVVALAKAIAGATGTQHAPGAGKALDRLAARLAEAQTSQRVQATGEAARIDPETIEPLTRDLVETLTTQGDARTKSFREVIAALTGAPEADSVRFSPAMEGDAMAASPVDSLRAYRTSAEPVPVAQAARPEVAVEPRQVLDQVRGKVSEDGRIRVALRPEGLGALEIDLAPDEAGRLQVTVRAEQASVLTALRADRDGLVALLRDAGHALDNSSLTFADMGGQGTRQGQRQGAPQGQGFSAFSGEAPAEQDIDIPLQVAAGGVDIRV
ncbi:flagellar hook-length control protein FliK [Sagittula salina]|uniref:Flagellar hook-length control protein FliK n=1 Tax=Sagittula salina TaxID=2820268 RepID=A0A940MRG3_9RHOB|nr:flagellar hook-length control protein FliK [Sagittula salina]MBP0484573.1 flagellar hook-length control protein FliK [Sagittula salina]